MTGATARAATLLERYLGLSPGSVGARAIESAIRRRMTLTNLADADAYLARLATDHAELEELGEAVVVPETWFFRYPESFHHLAAWALERRTRSGQGRPLRLLSIPCSTGEEPYSIVMALLDAGLPLAAFRVEAIDVCRRVIAAARAGAYSPSAFRGQQLEWQTRYFEASGGGFIVRKEIRDAVTFRTGNLLDPHVIATDTLFDAIFCRNLFIYLTPEARRRAVDTLDRHLVGGGLIYMGHAEPLGLIDARFHSIGRPQAFVFARVEAIPPLLTAPATLEPRPLDFALPVPRPKGPDERVPTTGPARPEPQAPVLTPGGGRAGSAALLTQARTAADRGESATAAALCEQALREQGPHPEAFALLGVVYEMAGDRTRAEQAFSRALYLDPGHYDALVHMMVLAQNRGDTAAAANFRRRADLVARQGGRS